MKRSSKKFSITTKFVLSFLFVALVPLAIATRISYDSSRNTLVEEITNGLLAVAFRTRSRQAVTTTQLLRFTGHWDVDRRNRLRFRVDKGRSRHDALIFDAAWELDDQHRLGRLSENRQETESFLNSTLWYRYRNNFVSKKTGGLGALLWVEEG